jgi:hypothetical protein
MVPLGSVLSMVVLMYFMVSTSLHNIIHTYVPPWLVSKLESMMRLCDQDEKSIHPPDFVLVLHIGRPIPSLAQWHPPRLADDEAASSDGGDELIGLPRRRWLYERIRCVQGRNSPSCELFIRRRRGWLRTGRGAEVHDDVPLRVMLTRSAPHVPTR